jgi:hypothetical protein
MKPCYSSFSVSTSMSVRPAKVRPPKTAKFIVSEVMKKRSVSPLYGRKYYMLSTHFSLKKV